jgi:hypothetical protein
MRRTCGIVEHLDAFRTVPDHDVILSDCLRRVRLGKNSLASIKSIKDNSFAIG